MIKYFDPRFKKQIQPSILLLINLFAKNLRPALNIRFYASGADRSSLSSMVHVSSSYQADLLLCVSICYSTFVF